MQQGPICSEARKETTALVKSQPCTNKTQSKKFAAFSAVLRGCERRGVLEGDSRMPLSVSKDGVVACENGKMV